MSALINCSLITIHYIIERRYCAYLPRLKSRVSRTNFNEENMLFEGRGCKERTQK